MRIGIDARFYGSLGKGLGRYTAKLIEALEALPGEDTFVVFLRRENFDEYVPQSGRFTKVLADFPWYGWREQIFFPWLIWREHIELMHFPHFNVPLLVGKPFVVTIHDLILFHYPTIKASELSPLLYWLKYAAYRLVIWQAIWRARVIFAVSHFTANDIVKAFSGVHAKVRVTYEAAGNTCAWTSPEAAGQFLAQHGLSMRGSGQAYILMVGNAYPHKNLELMLDVAARIPEKLFVCVGREDFFYARLKRSVVERSLGNVRFLGFVPDQYLPLLYREAESYFFPSLYEGFGLPGLEAASVGTPVVAAQAGALPEILGEAALYCDPHSAVSAKAELERIGSDRVLRQQCIDRGYARAKQFSWQRLAEVTLRGYHESTTHYARHPTVSTRTKN